MTQVVGQEELVNPGIRGVQETEAVLAALDLEVRLNRTVHQELVSDEAVMIERVEPRRSVPVEPLVLDHERYVEQAAGESQRLGVRIFLDTGIEVVEHHRDPCEAAVYVLRREAEQMVVVPQGGRPLAHVRPLRRLSGVVVHEARIGQGKAVVEVTER